MQSVAQKEGKGLSRCEGVAKPSCRTTQRSAGGLQSGYDPSDKRSSGSPSAGTGKVK